MSQAASEGVLSLTDVDTGVLDHAGRSGALGGGSAGSGGGGRGLGRCRGWLGRRGCLSRRRRHRSLGGGGGAWDTLGVVLRGHGADVARDASGSAGPASAAAFEEH